VKTSYNGLSILALLAVTLFAATESLAGPQSAARGAENSRSLTLVKLKCGLNEDGDFFCKNVKKHKHHDDDDNEAGEHQGKHEKHGKHSNKENICEGPNECPAGYRDLEKPSKYGACCEEIKDGDKAEQKNDAREEPQKSSGCHQVANMQEMNCAGAISCSARENGVMTCCCTK